MKHPSNPKWDNLRTVSMAASRAFSNMEKLVPFLFIYLAIATIFSFFFLFSPYPFIFIPKKGLLSLQYQQQHQYHDHNNVLSKTQHQQQLEQKNCDLFKGQWVPELRGSLYYTNLSCATIPESKNCFRNGRSDEGFVSWRWKPDDCELPRFDAEAFLEMVRGKKLAFIGDSVSRNQMESLLCLLSPIETPKDIYKDSKDRFRTWYFPGYGFTLMTLWTTFLVVGQEREAGSDIFDLQLDKVDQNWASHLPDIDYAIISDGHWFFKKMYLHQGSNLTGCVYCGEPNVTDRSVGFAVQMAFRAALNHINGCSSCNGLVTILRTFAPAHFEHGAWNTGGYCNRTSPISEKEIDFVSSSSFDLELRGIQLEEIERVKKDVKDGKKFGVVDVTKAMLMRPDAHPGAYWNNYWVKHYIDCVHWCMPGPIDYWNDFLVAIMKKEIGLES